VAENPDPNGLDDTSPHHPALHGRGELLNRYVLLDVIGAGGGGQVFRAFDRELERQVAIKLLARGQSGPTSTFARRLRREAQANALLQHPNVVSVFDVGEHQGEVFIAMEYVDGGSLKEWLERSPPLPDILRTFLQAGEGLMAAHAKGMVHRDFKPANVLLGRDGRPRVCDFGLARGRRTAEHPGVGADDLPVGQGPFDEAITQTGTVLGTPAYMAPEQFEGRMVDERADQFSFCLALAEAVVGTRARRGKLTPTGWQPEPGDPHAWLRTKRMPPRLREVLVRGMAPDPSQRFDSLLPVLEGLRRELGQGRTRQRLAIGSVGAAAVLAGAGLWWTAEAPCSGLQDSLTDVWNDDRRTQLTQRMTKGSMDGWAEVWSAVGRYASQWASARTDVCTATHVRGEQSQALLDVRMACLDQRLEGLRVLLGLVEAGRIDSVDQASEALLRLSTPAGCVGVLGGGIDASVDDPRQAAAIAEVQRGFAELEALLAAGLITQGLARSHELGKLADATGHPRTRAEAHGWIGRMEAANDHLPAAVAAWEQTLLFAEAAGNDGLRLEAHVALIRLDEGTGDRAGETDRIVARARALLERLGSPGLPRAGLSAALGQLSFRRGEFEACRTHGEQAVLLLGNLSGVPLYDQLQASEDLARCLERQGLRKRAAEVVGVSLSAAQRQLGDRHPRVVRMTIQLSRALDFSGDREGAERAAQRAVELALDTMGPGHSTTARAHQALANVMFRRQDFAGSEQQLRRALEIMERVHGPRSHQVGGLLSSLGLSLSRRGRYEEADAAHRRSVEVLGASVGLLHPETAAAWGRLAANLADRGDCVAALPHYRTALETLRANDPQHARILDQVRGLAGCLLQLGRPEEAVAPLEEGLALSPLRDEPGFYTSTLEFQAAQALWETGHSDRAWELAQTALARVEALKLHPELQASLREWMADRNR
jgi:tetratricopeptide (TPR) repeat protein